MNKGNFFSSLLEKLGKNVKFHNVITVEKVTALLAGLGFAMYSC